MNVPITPPRAYVASASDLLPVAEDIAADWDRVGATGHLLARNLDTGEELGFDVEEPVPIASVVKVPIALVVLDLVAAGELDAARPVVLDPATRSVGPTGTAAFTYPATIAVGDLVLMMLTVSDNAAGDALLDLVGLERAVEQLREWSCGDLRLRHPLQRLYEVAAGVSSGDFDLARTLAVRSDDPGDAAGGAPGDASPHPIETLDPAYGNVASARTLVDLLDRVWCDRIARPAATAELRRLMALQVFTQRLSGDLRTDAVRVSGKTGTFLHLRHEIGVVESDAGDRVAVAALTRSTRRAFAAADVDLAIGAAGRTAFEALRSA